ncbi:lamin tail domain-containing protein 2 [Phyllostomus discolor]|uniref:Lamin tail domain-containing protein 2 n=1 Tax=Phyllostomus discolor TaxID=89673 RepID=A0A7E6E3N5_9CHIR|nr:lamin tail domain-containing protein 2 [Phyllostomus discolor]
MTRGPESGLKGGEAKKGAPSSLGNEEPVSGHRSLPAGTPADLVAPKGRKDTKATPTRVGLQSAPKVLDPRPLQLPLGQRELDIQALRYAAQDRQDARHRRILQEVAGLPPERGPHSQDRFLRAQVQKLTLELEEQKERAQLERDRLEEQLLQTQTSLQQREAELQALHKSCLVKLAHSSWVGRMLRSSTGSVEVVTAETLVDPSDSSENDEASPGREGFRLEDVDWNTIAHRYPNLLANIKSNSDYKHPRPRTPPRLPVDSLPDECGPESSGRQHRLKSVEWDSGTFVGSDNSRGANSDSSSWPLDERSGVQKATGHPLRSPGHISFQHIGPPGRSLRRDSDAEPEGGVGRGGAPRLGCTHCPTPWRRSCRAWPSLEPRVGWLLGPLPPNLRGVSQPPEPSHRLPWRGPLRLLLSHVDPPGHCRPVGSPADAPYGGPPSEQDLRNRRSLQAPLEPTQTSRARWGPQTRTTGLQRTLGGEGGAVWRSTAGRPRGSPAGGALTCHTLPSETSSCVKIVAVSLSKGFVRILNESAEETADLGGSTLQQLEGDFPVRTYRFPPHTLLEPQHHVTVRPTHRQPARPRPSPKPLTHARRCPQVWGEGPGCTKKQPGPSSVGRKPAHFHPSPSFVTLLLSPKGEVLSKYQAPLCPVPTLRIFDDTDLSIDRFLLSEAQPRADAQQQRRPPRLSGKRRRREARAQSRRPRWGPRVPRSRSRPPPQAPPHPRTPSLRPGRSTRHFCTPTPRPSLGSPRAGSSPHDSVTPAGHRDTEGGRAGIWREGPRREGEAGPHPPSLSHTEDGPSLTVYRYKMKPTVRVCRKSVDRGCPMVALSVQSRANSRFRLPGCPPITVDACRRV